MKEAVYGEVLISAEEVRSFKGGNEITIFKPKLKSFTSDPGAGWYARKLIDGKMWHFYWNIPSITPSLTVIKRLQKEKYEIAPDFKF